MKKEVITTDFILKVLQEAVETKKNLGAEIWADAAFKLNILLGDEEDLSKETSQKRSYELKPQMPINKLRSNLVRLSERIYKTCQGASTGKTVGVVYNQRFMGGNLIKGRFN